MKPQYLVFAVLLIFAQFSCSKDDDGVGTFFNFYSGADKSATKQELNGTWAIFRAEFEGRIVDVPINYQDCGRDFFIYANNNIYTEYLYQNSNCEYAVNILNWELDDGVITLSNSFGQREELVITKLNQDELIFKSRFDVDEDGTLDILTLHAQKYQPTEVDFISNTFRQNLDNDLINFNWQTYNGFNEFNRYEIYRSVGDNCSKQNAVLVSTITDVNITQFTDLNPPAEERLCYYLKIYTNQGLLGESILNDLTTQTIYPKPTGLNQPMVINNQIEFNWQVSNEPYFSHYELAFSNYGGGTASASQEYTVAIINDVNTTTYIDENPPYLENPYYVLYVHNIFGNKTSFVNNDVTTNWEVEYKREEIIDFQSIQSYTIDSQEPVIYFYGRERGEGNSINIHRVNYETNQSEVVANLSPQYQTSVPIKVFSSPNGKEIFIEQASDLFVYNAETMEYKYTLNPGILGVRDFIYTNSGYWVFINSDDVFTFTRDNGNLSLIDTKPHFTNHQSYSTYQVFEINNDKLLVGHINESNSMVYSLDSNGAISFDQTVPIPVLDFDFSKTKYSATGDYLINFKENRLYSTINYTFLESFETPYFPSGISLDGSKIFGTNNDPDWQITPESLHAKEGIIFNRNTQILDKANTKGYPHVIFENYRGDIISISSGLKKDDIHQNVNNKADIFIEVIDNQ